MRIIAFVLDRPTIERILVHIGDRAQPPAVLPARSPPQGIRERACPLLFCPDGGIAGVA